MLTDTAAFASRLAPTVEYRCMGSILMTQHFAELLMYVAPEPVRQANERWLARIIERLGATRRNAEHLSLMDLWLSPNCC